MSIFGFSGGNLLRLAKRDSRLAARGSGSQARKIASPFHLPRVWYRDRVWVKEIQRHACISRRLHSVILLSDHVTQTFVHIWILTKLHRESHGHMEIAGHEHYQQWALLFPLKHAVKTEVTMRNKMASRLSVHILHFWAGVVNPERKELKVTP